MSPSPPINAAFAEQRRRDFLTRAENDQLARAARRPRPRLARAAASPLRLIRLALSRTATTTG